MVDETLQRAELSVNERHAQDSERLAAVENVRAAVEAAKAGSGRCRVAQEALQAAQNDSHALTSRLREAERALDQLTGNIGYLSFAYPPERAKPEKPPPMPDGEREVWLMAYEAERTARTGLCVASGDTRNHAAIAANAAVKAFREFSSGGAETKVENPTPDP